MTAQLIKADRAHEVMTAWPPNAVDEPASVPAIAPDRPVPSPERALTIELREAVAARDAQIAEHPAALRRSYDEGVAAGRAAAAMEFEESRVEALALLEMGLTNAREDLESALSNFEGLALAAASAAVDHLIGEEGHHRDLLTRAIAARAAQLRGESIVAITVSREDFPDTREVAALSEAAGFAGERIAVSDELAAGSCVISLELGAVEFSLRQHWAEMVTMLKNLVDDGGPDG